MFIHGILKQLLKMAKIKLTILFVIIVSTISCLSPAEKQLSNENNAEISIDNPLQKKEDLLFGISDAICYSGFRSGQHPDRGNGAINPSYEETLEDLRILAQDIKYKLIRIYDSGENSATILSVIRENKIGIKVLLGIWLRAEISNHETCEWLSEPIAEEELLQNKKLNLIEIEKGIKLANEYKDIVIAVNVGNESLVDWNDHKVSVDTLISYVKKVKKSIAQKVTVADNYKWWAEHGKVLSQELDFISVHIYPIWEGKDINEGLSYSEENIMEVRKALPNVKIVITEAGWPSVASEFGDQASEEKQQKYYTEFMSWSKKMNITTFWFEAFDEDWKGNPDNINGAEKHWGLFTVDRKPKKVIQHFYAEQELMSVLYKNKLVVK